MLYIKKNKGFSLAEMMIVMLMLSIIFAAAAPILTKRATQTAEVKASTGSGVPVGTIIIWSFETLPQGDETGKWLECNGQSTDGYPELKAIAGENVPDYRGVFLRGQGSTTYSQNNGTNVGTTSTTYSSGDLGTKQGDAIRKITGDITVDNRDGAASGGAFYYKSGWSWGFSGGGATSYSMWHKFDTSRITPTSTEIRPINVAVKYIIKAKS